MQAERKQRGKREAAAKWEWKHLVAGAMTAILVTIFLIGIGALLIVTSVIPEQTGDGCVLVACAVGALVGGCAAVRGRRKGALLYGIGAAFLMAAALVVSGVILYGGVDAGRCITISGACLCGGGVAGVINGGNGKKRRG